MKTSGTKTCMAAALLLAISCGLSAQDSPNLRVMPGNISVYAEWNAVRGECYYISIYDNNDFMIYNDSLTGGSTLVGGLNINASYKLRLVPRNAATSLGDSALFTTGNNLVNPPPQLVADLVTPDSVHLIWTPGNTDQRWTLEYRPTTLPLWVAALSGTTNMEATLRGLTSGTDYIVRLSTVSNGYCINTEINVHVPCRGLALPFVENLDTFQAGGSSSVRGMLPTCWYRTSSDISSNVNMGLSNAASHSGLVSFQFYSRQNIVSCAMLPYLDIVADSLILSFWVKGEDPFEVGVMTNPDDEASFTPIATVQGDANFWRYVYVHLNYAGYGHYVAFRSKRQQYCSVYIDDIRLEYLPSCIWPTNLVCRDVAPTSLTLSWHESGSAQAWILEYDTVPLDSSYAHPVALPFHDTVGTISGLQPGTTYYVRVYSDCGSELSRYVSGSFKTACAGIRPTYTENFDTWGSYISPCWYGGTSYGVGTAYPAVSRSLQRSGTRSINLYSASLDSAFLALPYSMVPVDSLTLSFWLYWDSYTISGGVLVGVMDNPYDMGTFVCIDTIMPTSGRTWEYFDVALSNYAGRGRYVAIMSPKGYTCLPYIDDLMLYYTPNCTSPTNLRTSNITDNSCTISWHARCEASRWIVEYAPINFMPSRGIGTLAYCTDTVCTLTGLVPNSFYHAYVRADCNGDTSFSRHITFSTLCGATWPPIAQDFDYWIAGSNINLPIGNCYYRGTSYRSTTTIYPYVCQDNAHSAENSLLLFSDAGCYSYLALPAVAASIDSLMLSFYILKPNISYPHSIQVGVMDSPNDIGSFTPVQTVTPRGSTWELVEVPLASYRGSGRYVALLSPDSYVSTPYIDDILLDYAPSCLRPRDLTLDTTVDSTAYISWGVVHGAQCYVMSVTAADDIPQNGTLMSFTSNSGMIRGLLPGTRYDVYVRAVCGAGDSSQWAGPLHVATNIHRMRVSASDTISLCGGILYDDGGPNGEHNPDQSSVVVLKSIPSYYGGHPVRLQGSVNCAPGSTVAIYDGYIRGNNRIANLSGYHPVVGPYTATNPDGILTVLFQSRGVSHPGFEFFVTCDHDVCAAVDSLTAFDVGDTCASLEWIPRGIETLWEVACDTDWFVNPTIVYVTDTPMCTIGNLRPGKPYMVRVRPVCGVRDTGEALYGRFVTSMVPTIPCERPQNPSVITTSRTTAKVRWEGVGHFKVQYKDSTSSEWGFSTIVSGTTHTFTGLSPLTRYDWRVRGFCSATRQSVWVTSSFTTGTSADGDMGLQVPQLAAADTMVVIYPNPAPFGTSVNVSIIAPEGDASLQLFDIAGRMVFSSEPRLSGTEFGKRPTFCIPHTALTRGTYFLKVQTPKASVVKKLIVR